MKEQDLPRFEATTVSELDTFVPGFSAKKNCSADKDIHLKKLNIQ